MVWFDLIHIDMNDFKSGNRRTSATMLPHGYVFQHNGLVGHQDTHWETSSNNIRQPPSPTPGAPLLHDRLASTERRGYFFEMRLRLVFFFLGCQHMVSCYFWCHNLCFQTVLVVGCFRLWWFPKSASLIPIIMWGFPRSNKITPFFLTQVPSTPGLCWLFETPEGLEP